MSELDAALTLIIASIAGWWQLHSAPVQGPMLVLLAAACFLAVLEPRRAWRWAVLVGFSVPIAHAIARLTGAPLPDDVARFTWPFIAVIPAVVGAALGVGMRRATRHER
jgi:hypothetical protein